MTIFKKEKAHLKKNVHIMFEQENNTPDENFVKIVWFING